MTYQTERDAYRLYKESGDEPRGMMKQYFCLQVFEFYGLFSRKAQNKNEIFFF